MKQDLAILKSEAIAKEDENELFLNFLKYQDSEYVDKLVLRLNREISSQIDCTQCGNCCRSLMINVQPQETEYLSAFLNMPLENFKDQYVEESQQGQFILNTIPCHFLTDNKCSIYDHRFTECRNFPHLHKPGFINRLFGTFMHYGRCPIVFHVIEMLKNELHFKNM